MVEAELADFIWVRRNAGVVVSAIEVGGDSQAGLSLGRAHEVENLLVAVEGFARPVFRDLGEEAVLNGIPFRGAGWVVGDGDGETEVIREPGLDFGFPGPAAATIASAGVGQDEEVVSATVGGSPRVATNRRWNERRRRECHGRRPQRSSRDGSADRRCRKGSPRRGSRSGSRDR